MFGVLGKADAETLLQHSAPAVPASIYIRELSVHFLFRGGTFSSSLHRFATVSTYKARTCDVADLIVDFPPARDCTSTPLHYEVGVQAKEGELIFLFPFFVLPLDTPA